MLLKTLYDSLKQLGIKEADQILSLVKIADSRWAIVQQLGMTKKEADFFNSLSPQKAFNIARWYKEWADNKLSADRHHSSLYGPENGIEENFNYFKGSTSINGDNDYIYEPRSFSFIDYVIEDDSLYQKCKKKPLDAAIEDFHKIFLRKEHPGNLYHKVNKDLAWYDVGEECDIISGFLNNCGSLGSLGSEGEYGNGSFSMVALKDKNKKPIAVVTIGVATRISDDQLIDVIVNLDVAGEVGYGKNAAAISAALFNMARAKNLKFAKLYEEGFGDGKEEILQSPGLDETMIQGGGFKIEECWISDSGPSWFEKGLEEAEEMSDKE